MDVFEGYASLPRSIFSKVTLHEFHEMAVDDVEDDDVK